MVIMVRFYIAMPMVEVDLSGLITAAAAAALAIVGLRATAAHAERRAQVRTRRILDESKRAAGQRPPVR
jgi:hypothetical protein